MIDWNKNPPLGISNSGVLLSALQRSLGAHTNNYGFDLALSPQRVKTAFECWKNDLERNGQHNFQTPTTPDHIKSAAFLAYWLRRCSPIIELTTTSNFTHDAAQLTTTTPINNPTALHAFLHGKSLLGQPVQAVLDHRTFLAEYMNEYLPFVFVYSSILHIEQQTRGICSHTTPSLKIQNELCVVLKYKNVSPHALYLIFLFMISNWK